MSHIWRKQNKCRHISIANSLWVINHQFMNHKCAGEPQDALWGGRFLGWNLWKTDVLHRFAIWMLLFLQIWTGRWGKWKGRVGDSELTFPPCVMSSDTWYDAKVKAKGKWGSDDVSRVCRWSFKKGGRKRGETKHDTVTKSFDLCVFKGQFRSWLTLQTCEIPKHYGSTKKCKMKMKNKHRRR